MVLTSTFKTAAFSALALSVAGLSGCMSVNLTPDEITTVTAEATSYNNSHSFAWNITKVMGLEKTLKMLTLTRRSTTKLKPPVN